MPPDTFTITNDAAPWSAAEDTVLQQLLIRKEGERGLRNFATSRRRSLESVVARIELLNSRPRGLRKCMNTACRAEFVTPDPKRIHHCDSCRKALGFEHVPGMLSDDEG